MSHKMISITQGYGKFEYKILISIKHIVSIEPSDYKGEGTIITTINKTYKIPIPYSDFLQKYPNTIRILQS